MPTFRIRSVLVDFARERAFIRSEFSLWLDAFARVGINSVGLYLEGAFELPSFPGTFRPGVMSMADAAWATAEAEKRGISLFPMTNVVGHMEHFLRQERFAERTMEANSLHQIDFTDPTAREFSLQIAHDFAKAFPGAMLHIGGDEVHLTPETKHVYAKFLGDICQTLLDEGLTPAIWADMIWMDQELCAYIPRETVLFDWNYYGHRPESLAYFRDQGFTKIIAANCDQSWEGFISFQHASNYQRSHGEIALLPEEVEAFLSDAAAELPDPCGMTTFWNNETGRNIWAQMSTLARAGLYMSGQITEREQADEKIEMALFGRVTPYTAVAHYIRAQLPWRAWHGRLRNAMYGTESLLKLFAEPPAFDAEEVLRLRAVGNEADRMLSEWVPEGIFEQHCRDAMVALAAMLRAAGAMYDLVQIRPIYRAASKIQFEDAEEATKLLGQVCTAFERAADAIEDYADAHRVAIDGIGHAKRDLARLARIERILMRAALRIAQSASALEITPIPRMSLVLEHVALGKDMYV